MDFAVVLEKDILSERHRGRPKRQKRTWKRLLEMTEVGQEE